MFFTQEDYKKIQKWILANSIKDTEFAGAALPLKGNETVAFVQDGVNVKVSLKDLISQIFLLGVSDFLNVTDKYGESYISLTQAIQLVPFKSRKVGQVITFLNEDNKWVLYQFTGVLNQWNNNELWVDLIKSIQGLSIIDSEDIVAEVNTQEQTSLLLANKNYNEADYSGLGRIYLRKNITKVTNPTTGALVTVNLLTQDMISKENTIYVIHYDFTLTSDVTIPENCILEFDGGSINGNQTTITFNNTILEGNIKVRGCIISGTLINYLVHINWFHNVEDDIADTLQYLISSPRHTIIDKGLWYVSKSTKIVSNDTIIEGEGKSITTIKVTDTAARNNIWVLGTHYQYEYDYNSGNVADINISIRNIHISDITFNPNRGNIEHSVLSPLRTYSVFLRDVEHAIIERCDFVDNMTATDNNGEPAIIALLCKDITVKNCSSYNVTLFGCYTCINCKAFNNYGNWSVGTWLETDYGYGHELIGNTLEGGCFWPVSSIGINSKNCTICNNVVNQDGTRIVISGITLGHPNIPADNSLVRGNKLICNNAKFGIFIQDGTNIIIEQNDIYLRVASISDYNFGIGSGKNCKISNNKIDVNCTGISSFGGFIDSNNITNSKVGIVSNNIPNGNTIITNNIVNSTDCSIDVRNNGETKGNIVNNTIVCVPYNSHSIANNVIKFTGEGITPVYGKICMYIITDELINISDNIIIGSEGYNISQIIYVVSPNVYSKLNVESKTLIKSIHNNVVKYGTYTGFFTISNNDTQRTIPEEAFIQVGATRPNLTNIPLIGYEFFDTTLSKSIYWTGSNWVDATGATV